MRFIRQVVVFDAADIDAESSFWAGMLDGRVYADDSFHCVMDSHDEWRIGVQFAPNHVPPEWPGGSQQQQVHIDLHVDDINAAHERAIAHGATVLQPADDLTAEEGFQVYADPAGHPFCIGWGHPDEDQLRAFLETID